METEEEFRRVSMNLWKIFIFMRHIFLNIPEDREPKPQPWPDQLTEAVKAAAK